MQLRYITTATFPASKASAVQVMQMCAAFAQAGMTVTLHARSHADQMATTALLAHYAVPTDFMIEQRALPRVPRAHDVMQIRAAWKTATSPWVAYSRGRDVTAVQAALLRPAQTGPVAAAVEVHGRPNSRREAWQLQQIARSKRGFLVALGEVLREIYVTEYGVAREKIVVAPDGVDLARFTPVLSVQEARRALGLPVNRPMVVYVGGLYSGRGLEPLFAAVAETDAMLLVVGGRDDAEVAQWRQRLTGTGIDEAQVAFAGHRPPRDVPHYLFAADVLAMPYGARTLTPSGEDTTAWMSPLKLFEYMAAGRAIVATDLPALRTVLRHNHNAVLVPPDDAGPMTEALRRLLGDGELRQRLGEQARETATHYTWLSRARHILKTILPVNLQRGLLPESET